MSEWLGSVPWPLLPMLIFVAEMTVVTLGTLRIIFLSRGMKVLAPLVGFFEICIWLFAIGQIMQNLSDPWCYLAFAGGFTLGNFLGVLVEKWLAIGTLVVRIITSKDPAPLVATLQAAGFGVTRLRGHGATGPVEVIFSIVRRKALPQVAGLITAFDSRAFYSVDPIQSATAGVFPTSTRRFRSLIPTLPLLSRLSRSAA
ncbi:MAG: DUF2179 domain-containing protein [Gemmataceae bacterium]